jgi:hypothetical protein
MRNREKGKCRQTNYIFQLSVLLTSSCKLHFRCSPPCVCNPDKKKELRPNTASLKTRQLIDLLTFLSLERRNWRHLPYITITLYNVLLKTLIPRRPLHIPPSANPDVSVSKVSLCRLEDQHSSSAKGQGFSSTLHLTGRGSHPACYLGGTEAENIIVWMWSHIATHLTYNRHLFLKFRLPLEIPSKSVITSWKGLNILCLYKRVADPSGRAV